MIMTEMVSQHIACLVCGQRMTYSDYGGYYCAACHDKKRLEAMAPVVAQPDALKRLERWLCDALIGERKVEIEIDGRISYYCRIFDLRGSWYGESDDDLHAAVNEALDVAEGVNHE